MTIKKMRYIFSYQDDRVDQREKSRPTLERSYGLLMTQVFQDEMLGRDVVTISTPVTPSIMPPSVAVAPETVLCAMSYSCECSLFKVLDQDR